MITLYTHGTPNGHKIAIALEELKLEYRIELVNVFAGEGQTPAFLAISPAGKIPALEDSETHRTLYESNAILIYLAEKAGALWPNAEPERTEANALMFLQASLQGPMFGQRAHFSMFAPETIPYGIKRYEQQAQVVDEVCDRLLDGRDYFLRSGFSVIDIAFFGWYFSANRSGYLRRAPANLRNWFERVNARPCVKRGIDVTPLPTLPPRKLADHGLTHDAAV